MVACNAGAGVDRPPVGVFMAGVVAELMEIGVAKSCVGVFEARVEKVVTGRVSAGKGNADIDGIEGIDGIDGIDGIGGIGGIGRLKVCSAGNEVGRVGNGF